MDVKKIKKIIIVILIGFTISSCSKNEDTSDNSAECTSSKTVDTSRGECSQTLTSIPSFSMTISGGNRIIQSNAIPNHKVGLYGGNVSGSLGPNTISAQNESYTITASPIESNSYFPLLNTSAVSLYSFGILLNGVELDPIAAEPWPHTGIMSPNVNWEWNLEALNVRIGLDCNNAHVQPTGKYHYHGSPVLYLSNLNVQSNVMTLIGYAADGFPIYHKYAYVSAMNSSSNVIVMTSSYRLKSGNRPGDGVSAPCGIYDGVYSNDYEYIEGLGTLDQANGRKGVTPEYPNGTYYYVITDEFPSIPRYFRGTPSNSFKVN